MSIERIEPRSGVAFKLKTGEYLDIIDAQGCQVADMLAYSADDIDEVISNGRTFDYEETIKLTTGNCLWSNRSNRMLQIVADDVGCHDFLLTPCSDATFRHFYPDQPVHRGCFGNLAEALASHGVTSDMIPTAFNVFMNVAVDGKTGVLEVLSPPSKKGDTLTLRAEMDLIVGVTACSAYASNGGTFKPIDFRIHSGS